MKINCRGKPSVRLSDEDAERMARDEIDEILNEYSEKPLWYDPYTRFIHIGDSRDFVVTVTRNALIFVTFRSSYTAELVRTYSAHFDKCILKVHPN